MSYASFRRSDPRVRGVCTRVAAACLAPPRRRARFANLALACALVACNERQSSASPTVGGTMVISAFADPDILIPPLTMTGQGQQVVDAIFDGLALPEWTADGSVRYVPMLATTWRWSSDSLAIDFTLDPKATWHDGTKVTADDVRFTWLAYTDSTVASPAASALTNIDSVQVLGPHDVRVWFATRTAEQLADAATQMRILPKHLLDSIPRAAWRTSAFARSPVGTGRFRFGRWLASAQLDVVADTNNYRGRPGLDRVIWTVSPDPSAATARLFAREADFLESVRPDAAAEFASHKDVMLLQSPSLVYGFLQFNLDTPQLAGRPHPLFGDRSLRRALSMVVDRPAAVRAVFDTLARVALGPMTRIQVGGDSTLPAIPFDVGRGAALLDSLGWTRADTTSTRSRNGVRLRFTVLVPATSTPRLRLAALIQQNLKDAGVQMEIEKVEFAAFNARLADGAFDATIMAIGADPQQSGIRGVWTQSASRVKGGQNFGSYASATFDALVDSAAASTDVRRAKGYYQRAYRVIIDDAPAIWLYEPWNLSGIRRALSPVGVRPDGWWMQLGDWTRTVTDTP
ncbi:MAG: peptide ABC transporter substrate-binding protein [Gemmatimonadaceae bacterium]|nr:peptide ABC transporter substrate-binding protein [Gemmatimonadaceae bacterium]